MPRRHNGAKFTVRNIKWRKIIEILFSPKTKSLSNVLDRNIMTIGITRKVKFRETTLSFIAVLNEIMVIHFEEIKLKT